MYRGFGLFPLHLGQALWFSCLRQSGPRPVQVHPLNSAKIALLPIQWGLKFCGAGTERILVRLAQAT